MTRLALAASVATLALISAGKEAVAVQMMCVEADSFVDGIHKMFGETTSFTGTMTSNGAKVSIFISPKGEWVAMMEGPNGMICELFEGTDWKASEAAVPVKPAPESLPAAPSLLPHDLILIHQ